MRRLFVIPCMLAIAATPSRAATTWPSVGHYSWNFTLSAGVPSTSTLDQLAIQFDSANKLTLSELFKIRLFSGNDTVPMYSLNFPGSQNGYNGIATFQEGWEVPLAGGTGRLELDLDGGSVDLSSITLVVATGSLRRTASISPNVRLIPEPNALFLCMIAGLGVMTQRVRVRHS